MSGSAASSKGYISCLAEYSGCRVYSLDYSLSPEVKYPVAFNECIDAVNELIKNNPDSKITLVGDSAGGNLSLAVALKLKETGKISCVIVHSPVTDFSDTLDRAKYKKDGLVVGNGEIGINLMIVGHGHQGLADIAAHQRPHMPWNH